MERGPLPATGGAPAVAGSGRLKDCSKRSASAILLDPRHPPGRALAHRSHSTCTRVRGAVKCGPNSAAPDARTPPTEAGGILVIATLQGGWVAASANHPRLISARQGGDKTRPRGDTRAGRGARRCSHRSEDQASKVRPGLWGLPPIQPTRAQPALGSWSIGRTARTRSEAASWCRAAVAAQRRAGTGCLGDGQGDHPHAANGLLTAAANLDAP
jgi:hypothetical protein